MLSDVRGRSILIFFVLLSICLLANNIHAQTDVEQKFFDHLIKGKDHLSNLYQTRGGGFMCDSKISFGHFPARDLQRIIANRKRGFLFYFHEEDSLHIYLITHSSVFYEVISITLHTFITLEQRFRNVLGVEELQRDRSPKKRGSELVFSESNKIEKLDDITKEVSQIILPPGIREGLHGIKNLIIQPSINIGLFPFAALKPFDWSPDAYLIDSISYSISPHICQIFSLEYYHGWNAIWHFTFENPLLVGDPLYYQHEYHFPELPGARMEVEKIHQLIGGMKFIGENAVLSAIKDYAVEADLLYFATHGISSLTNPLDSSFLTFSPDEQNTTGYWTAKDIQNQRFKADLAILSACQTGNGKVLEAGYVGLGRAFFKAGVPNIITSLWNVDDAATESMMVKFTETLQEPDYFFPSAHLRKAILYQKSITPEPKYWASFMVFGFGY